MLNKFSHGLYKAPHYLALLVRPSLLDEIEDRRLYGLTNVEISLVINLGLLATGFHAVSLAEGVGMAGNCDIVKQYKSWFCQKCP